MTFVELTIASEDLYYFDKFLRQALINIPTSTLRSRGESIDLQSYQLTYEGHTQINEQEVIFELKLTATEHSISPVEINVRTDVSKEEEAKLLKLIYQSIQTAKEQTNKKSMVPFEYEARLSTPNYTLKSTLNFGTYKLCPLNGQVSMCKLKFKVDAVDKDETLEKAHVEAKLFSAFLSVIFGILVTPKEVTNIISSDPIPILNLEQIHRPDLRGVKHSFMSELKNPTDFIKLFQNLYSMPKEIQESYFSGCLCFQTAMEMEGIYQPLSYQLFVTTIEVIAREVIQGSARTKFVNFITQRLDKKDSSFIDQLQAFYDRRSALVHEKGVGLGRIPSFGLRSYQLVHGRDLWQLEVIVNVALIGFLLNV